jgi:flagellar biosynthesis protein FliQ
VTTIKTKTVPVFSLVGLGIVVFVAAMTLLDGWVIMLLLGALHHSVSANVPALGFWPSVLIALVIGFIVGLFK